MKRNVWRAAVAAVGLLGYGGAVSAADPAGSSVVVISPDPVAPPTADAVVPAGGCAGCEAGKLGHGGNGLGFRIGDGCKNVEWCGSFATQRTFVFGSCRQFFSPGYDCNGPFGKCFKGPGTIYGPGGLGGHDPCVYSSFNDR